ncbi:KTSC domain-containing protein [Aequorivita xiaoshiensis]|uniref:KTSC domain-containing protein n=1 Tax=Aequorivita xiaoshiensis TaxID=2874476 RepID=A0A9X1QYX0_9FLAO|nr:KTSC domain-containing protein [Aequorivita xiaoshiensis]MCG2430383.1 KTSC domain-containing protein [Aequorivita xiaoshiensis]
MKRINEYKKLFGVEKDIELKALKSSYRHLIKEWHPDKFQEGDPLRKEAALNSRKIIDGYHFLVSIAPETKAANLEEFTNTITNIGIADFQHKGMLLEITYLDGSTYEFFGVTRSIYIKMINSDKLNRFARRTIYPKYLYRKSKQMLEHA